MKRTIGTVLAAAALAALLLFTTGCDRLKARDHLNKGVAAFKNANYPAAVDNFKKACEYDPGLASARLYLATAYMMQYIPGADSPENNQFADQAKKEFKAVLEANPNDRVALAYLANLAINETQGMPKLEDKIVKYDEAKEWNLKLIQVDPSNKEAYYSLGFIVWSKWYPALQSERAKLGMKPDEPGPIKDKKVKEELTTKYLAMINEGIKNLESAIAIDKEYDDAMAYMNLLIRERADLADSSEQYKKEIDVANDWIAKALEVKKIKTERASHTTGGGVQAGK